MRTIFTSVFLILLSLAGWSEDITIRYRVTIEHPINHYFKVQISISHMEEDFIDLQMPAWSPGRYLINNFARNVRDFQAASPEQPLHFQKTDKQTWRIFTEGVSQLTVTYQVYANTLSGEYSQLDDIHGFLHGTSLFMYVKDRTHLPVTLEVENFPDWMILSASGEEGQTVYHFPNYDLLVDELIQVGQFLVRTFTIGQTEFRVSIMNNRSHRYVNQFVADIEKLANAAIRLLGPLDTPRYTFFFHFVPDSKTSAGMEHLNSCQLTRQHDLMESGSLMDWTYWITAHEFAHAWNIKRLRPRGLGPFDYTREVHTPLLWFVEGCTSYLADLIMYHSGLWSRENLLQRIAENIQQYRSSPGRFERSAEQASFDTWLYDTGHYAENDWGNIWIDYYLKGNLIGYCLDFEIRSRTHNEQSFPGFFRTMYHQFYTAAGSESYYLKGKPYDTTDLHRTLTNYIGSDWQDVYQDLIAQPGDIDFERYFALAGFEVQPNPTQPREPYTGLHLAAAGGNYPRIDWIEENSPADHAGLDRDDIIIALDGERAQFQEYRAVFLRHAIDNEIAFTILRDDRLLQRNMNINPDWIIQKYSVTEQRNPTTLARRIRQDWLKRQGK
ncbi:MAG: M61 family metallopeptidase [bacterium]|jgi:predicted metalloprotease with PDZ domain